MGSLQVAHEAASPTCGAGPSLSSAVAMAPAPALPAVIEDYLFCNELLCSEPLDIHPDHSVAAAFIPDHDPSHSWHSLHLQAFSPYCGYGDHLSSSWYSSPSLLHSWSSSLVSSSSSSIASVSSPSSFDQHLHSERIPHAEELLDVENIAAAPCLGCSKMSSNANSDCSSNSSALFSSNSAYMQSSSCSSHGELRSEGCCSDMVGLWADVGTEEENGSGGNIDVLLERQRWQHCRPLKMYAEAMEQNDSKCTACIRDQRIGSKFLHGLEAYSFTMCRRRAVQWMLEAARLMHVRLCSVAQAVAYLDRYLSHQLSINVNAHTNHVASADDIHVAAVACLWIALKMEHSNAPDAAFMIQSLAGMFQYSQTKGMSMLKTTEERVLHGLAWRLLCVTSLEFVESLLSLFQASSKALPSGNGGLIPNHLVYSLETRANEIVQGTLLEVVFVGYEALVVGVCAIQHAVEEVMPLQATSIMQIIHENIAPSLDMKEVRECYKAMGDLIVDPLTTINSFIASPISHNMTYNTRSTLL